MPRAFEHKSKPEALVLPFYVPFALLMNGLSLTLTIVS